MARKFVLITDTGSDLPAEYYTQHDIDCIKLGFTLDGETYGEDGGEMDVKKFYELLQRRNAQDLSDHARAGIGAH